MLAALTKPIIEMLGVGMLGTTIVSGAYLVLNHKTKLLGITISEEPLSVSSLLIFFGMLVGASDPLRRLSAVYSQIFAAFVAADTVFNLLDKPSTVLDPENPKPPPARHTRLQLTNVSFGYSAEHRVIKDLSLDVPFGTTLAIIGHNGSGKSTLISLLCRFFDPFSGSLKLDDVDYKSMRTSDIRSKFALVNQHTELFNESIAYNIGYGSPAATPDQIKNAAAQAHAADFIEATPEGYNTLVGVNGQKLSGGQRQRIALARALLRDPEVLILDEATSQIDMRSEQLILQSLSSDKGRRTMIIITHREKLLEMADLVLELKEGRLTPASSLKAKPFKAA
jgi:ATP-binding cassette subfamily B protein/subfamily B ATP-binding cassette protein MsbA